MRTLQVFITVMLFTNQVSFGQTNASSSIQSDPKDWLIQSGSFGGANGGSGYIKLDGKDDKAGDVIISGGPRGSKSGGDVLINSGSGGQVKMRASYGGGIDLSTSYSTMKLSSSFGDMNLVTHFGSINLNGNYIGSNGQTSLGTNQKPSTLGGANLSDYKLFVNGGVLAKEVRVRTDWADYVFDPSYSLLSLPEVEDFIHTNGHLPNVPSATTVAEEGIEIGNMTRIQQEKIEELTLYTIQQNKQITAQQAKIESLEARLAKLEAFMTKK